MDPPRKVLELEGSLAGSIASAAGGDAYADVIVEAAPPSGFPQKHLSAVRYRDIVVEVGHALSEAFSSWLAGMPTSASPILKSGAVVTLDAAGREFRRLEFTQARVVELALPALEAAAGAQRWRG